MGMDDKTGYVYEQRVWLGDEPPTAPGWSPLSAYGRVVTNNNGVYQQTVIVWIRERVPPRAHGANKQIIEPLVLFRKTVP